MTDDYSHLVGHRFPGGRVTIPDWLAWLWCDAVGAENAAPFAHPGLAYLAAMQGSGVTFQDIFDLAGADAESGPMFGEQTLDFSHPLQIGTEYEVEGEITGVARKHGRRAGTFDMITFELRLRDPGGGIVATNVNTFIFPRVGAEGDGS
jgi:acyl dehydratase